MKTLNILNPERPRHLNTLNFEQCHTDSHLPNLALAFSSCEGVNPSSERFAGALGVGQAAGEPDRRLIEV